MSKKSFPITSICREDLEAEYTKKQIASLTDADMKYIAKKMANAYKDFWEDMKIIVDEVLTNKKK